MDSACLERIFMSDISVPIVGLTRVCSCGDCCYPPHEDIFVLEDAILLADGTPILTEDGIPFVED